MQLSQSGRVVTAVATSQGAIFTANAGDTAWHSPTNSASNTPPLNSAGLNFATPMNGKLWFVDGNHFVTYDPTTDTITDWTASAGSLPVDASSRTPRGIETWRGRVVMFGLLGDPFNWFMSKVGDATNFDYAPVSPGPADAVAGSTGPQGKLGYPVMGFVPFSDDIAICGTTSSLHLFSGDPQAGGTIDLITNRIGMAWGRAWTLDPNGTVYFFSSRCGIYTIVPGQQPQRISQQIEQLLDNIDTGANSVSAFWDDRFQGAHFFVTPTVAAGATTHFFYETRTGAWWVDVFSNPNHNPLCGAQFDGNNPQDRVVLIGSWDGVVRYLDPNAQNDDGRIIQSSVTIGPLLTNNLEDITLKEIQMVLGSDSNPVSYSILKGSTAELALAQTPFVKGAWNGGRNATHLIRVSGKVLYITVSSNLPWRMEHARAVIRTNGMVRARGKF